ncbi:MAG: proline--tRNA ligase, partial [Desulfohalobiaceae bacterium]
MRLSQYYVPTLREDPSEADVISHKLLLRAGMIRKLTSGLYSFLPHGFRALNKINAIVRREMDGAGCQEVLLPFVQPADLWQETGRWEVYGRELLRLKDRHQRDYCLGPTHEEVITDLVRDEIRSYRQLPVNLYQIQTKFRDEVRPRFGLMRCREFIMKDAYSFDRDEEENEESYRTMQRAYERIFSGLGLSFRSVEADSGPIGGSQSHEFMVLAETGEDSLVVCSGCGYAANLEKAEVSPPQSTSSEPNCPQPELVETPGMHTVADVAAYLGIPHNRVLKTLLYKADDTSVAALVPGNREINETKLGNLLSAGELELADAEAVRTWSGAEVGFSGPMGLSVDRVIADHSLLAASDWVCGANRDDAHYRHARLDRDAAVEQYADISTIREDDACFKCNGGLILHKGIEVGHVFKLGTKYSEAMNATYLDAEGRERLMVMGSYGIGVTRLLAAAIEQNHDEDGCFFPPPIAPFEVELIHLAPQDETLTATGEALRSAMEGMGADVLVDDREERPGVKFKDADLLGSPLQV